MKEPIYYLFGSDAAKIYFEHDPETATFEQLAEKINRAGCSVFMYDEMQMHPTDLLLAYDGWDGFAEIEAELYNLLKPMHP
jgi:hypothetical protein